MSMFRNRALLLVAALSLAATTPATGAQRAIIIYDANGINEPLAADRFRQMLLSRGFSVDDSNSVPGDLSQYCCAWDIRPFVALSNADMNAYLDFVQQGHGLFLLGENDGCCFDRNDSFETFINNFADGGPALSLTERLGTFSETASNSHPATTTPNNVNSVTFNGRGAANWDDPGRGTILTFSNSPFSQVSAAWSAGDLLNATQGRVVSVLDINWLVDEWTSTDNAEFAEDISYFLCPVTAGSLTVTITNPSTFNVECPGNITVTGVVNGVQQDCAQKTKLAEAPAITAAWQPPDEPLPADARAADNPARPAPALRSESIAGSVSAPMRTASPGIAALMIETIKVSVNGGPFNFVTSTSPGLPAPPPVNFTAANLPLVLGFNNIVIKAEDDNGNSATDSVSGNLVDTTPPVISPPTCADEVVDLGPGCVLSYDKKPTATDTCDPNVTITSTPPLPVIFPGPGSIQVDYEAIDDAGNKDTCSRKVTAQDISGPVLTCAPPTTVECTATGGSPASDAAIVAFLAATTAVDNCGLKSLNNDAPTFFDTGCLPGKPTLVTWTALDQSDNESKCGANLRVQDTTAPVFSSTPARLLLECTEPGGVPVSDPRIQTFLSQFAGSDVCSAAVTGSHDAPQLLPAGCAPGKTTTVTYTLSDDCSNEATASALINVVDSTVPVLVVPAPLVIECNSPGGVPLGDPQVQAWLASATASDLCGGASVSNDAPALLPSGCGAGKTTVVTFTATDDCGNPVTRTQTITVIDTQAPALGVPAGIVLECNGPGGIARTDPAIANWLALATAADVCGSSTLVNDAPTLFNSGCGSGAVTTVRFTATDDCGNAVTKTATVTVRDTTAPALVTPAPIELECNSAGGVQRSDPAVVSWLAAASASDVCDGATISNDAPALFPSSCPPGTTTEVTFTATDNCGNATPLKSSITVKDSIAPLLTAPAPLTLECNGPAGVPASDPALVAWLNSASASDVCGSPTITHNAPALFPSACGAGKTTTVVFTATDGCGNATTRSATVTVKDTTAPVVGVPAALTLECNGPGGIPASDPAIIAWLAAASASDVCDGATLSHNAPAFFPSGCGAGAVTTVTFSAVDNCGNTSSRTATVTVKDTTAPTLNVPAALILECNGPGGVLRTDPAVQAWLNAASASDVCDGATISNDAPALLPSGCGLGTTTSITFTAIDNCGNKTVKQATITVRDTTAPLLTVPAPIVLECNGPGGIAASDPAIVAWLATVVASDLCDGAIVANDAPALFPSGCAPGTVTTVTFTATDNCGNRAIKTSTVTVQDTTPPVVGPIGFEGICLWPPNHNFYCIDDVTTDVSASDVCDPDGPEVKVLSCVSSQPEDSTGDGEFAPDCVLIEDGRGVCVRSERQGGDPNGRVYTIEVGATDGCQNTASRKVEIHVPHDSSPHRECRKPNRGKKL